MSKMYYFLALLLTFVFLILTVGGETGRGRRNPRAFFFANLALSGIGVLMTVILFFLSRYELFGGSFEPEFAGWAWDMLAVYYRLSLIPLAVFLAVSALSFLIAAADPKQRGGFPLKLRLSVTVVFSVVMLLIAPMYSFMTVNEKVALDTWILLSGLGEALILRAPLLIEYSRRMRENSAGSVTGK